MNNESNSKLISAQYATPLRVQALYALLCMVWNVAVLWQIRTGIEPIGPTGSVGVIVGAMVLLALLSLSLSKSWQRLYLLLSVLVSLVALSAVYSSISNSSEAWSSAFWQYAGLAINVLGVVSVALVLAAFLRGQDAVE